MVCGFVVFMCAYIRQQYGIRQIQKDKFYTFFIVCIRQQRIIEFEERAMSNKERSPGNGLGQVSLPRDLLAESKAYAKKNGLPWATWVRTLIIKELDKAKKEGGSDSGGHRQAPALPLLRRAGVSSFDTRKC